MSHTEPAIEGGGCSDVFLHFVGTIFVVLWLSLEWSLAWYTWLFLIFSGFPAFVELTVAFGVLKLGLMEFS